MIERLIVIDSTKKEDVVKLFETRQRVEKGAKTWSYWSEWNSMGLESVEWWPRRKKIHLKERANGTRAPLPYEIGRSIVLREARRMRDPMRGRTDHSPRLTLPDDTLDHNKIPRTISGTVAARFGPYQPFTCCCIEQFANFNLLKLIFSALYSLEIPL